MSKKAGNTGGSSFVAKGGDIGGSSFIAKGHESLQGNSKKEGSFRSNKSKKEGAVAECFLNHNYFPGDPEFTKIIRQVEDGIEAGVYPQRISQGSSGSYFAKNAQGESVGVYKPKNEEPYAPRNPKWTKWFQKMLSPCCFGRSCLLDNQGYLSEAGASLIDDKLGLKVVPKTKVVWLAAPSLNYSALDRRKSEAKLKIATSCPKLGRRIHKIGLPPKVGSLQLFVKGYDSATTFLTKHDMDTAPENVKKEFQRQFERLVVLDYIIRNTDRGSDNWLIKMEEDPLASASAAPVEPPVTSTAPTDNQENAAASALSLRSAKSVASKMATSAGQPSPAEPPVKIAAIDNGLAFPLKHPDEWRTYPFGWATLKQAKEPFSDELNELLRSKLENINFVEELCCDLKQLFQLDKDFNAVKFEKQMSVMRGQMHNLMSALKEKKTPYDLVQMPTMTVMHTSGKTPGRKQKSRWSMYKKTDAKKQAVFKGW